MTDRELMQQALEALNRSDYLGWQLNIPIIKALRERLAQPEQPYPDNFIDALMYDVAKRDSEAQQAYEDAFVNGTGVMLGDKRIDPDSIYKEPEQEPVAWMHPDGRIWTFGRGFDKSTFTIPLYTTPPHRKPLTDEEINDIYDEVARREPYNMAVTRRNIARAIEAKLKEKNT